jgi:phospholipase C
MLTPVARLQSVGERIKNTGMRGSKRFVAGVAALVFVATAMAGTAAADNRREGQVRRTPELRDVQHIVVLMQENRSYDEYFGALSRKGGAASKKSPTPTNPNPLDPSATIAAFHQGANCEVDDLNHAWTGTHAEIDSGRMDGFTAQNAIPADATGSRAMGQYDSTDLPYYYGLANTFGIGDRYFTSVPGPTFPNRFYEMAGTSFGHIQNDFPPEGGWPQPTIFGRLQDAGISWKVYDAQFPTASFFADVKAHMENVQPISQYFADAAAGTLPQVAFVEPIYIGTVSEESDEHPPANMQVGQEFTANVLHALMASRDWSSSAFFLTWDEHGGYYDHVAPPAAPVPDSIPPILGPGDVPAAFDHYGVRVPFVVVSPFAKPHFVSHRVSDHTSIPAFIERRFNLLPLTQRDAKANTLLEYFDFAHPHFTKPPKLPTATVDPSKAAQCAALDPGTLGV